jgi:hypothetical protein
MSTIVTRAGKGSPLTNTEVDSNFTNLNDDKLEKSGGTMTGDLSFGDTKKAIFGSGSDLQIYHDGSNSYIQDAGTGRLFLKSNGSDISLSTDADIMLKAINDGAVELYYDNNKKLATTSTGIDVTGNVVSDGASLDGAVVINESGADADFRVESDTKTHAFFLDGATGHIGLGRTPPSDAQSSKTHLFLDEGACLFTQTDDNDNGPYLTSNIYYTTANNYTYIGTGYGAIMAMYMGDFNFSWMNSGSAGTAATAKSLLKLNGRTAGIIFNDEGDDIDFRVESDTNTHALFVDAGNSRVGIGESAPRTTLHITDSSVASFYTDIYAPLIIEDIEARLQIIAEDGGGDAAALILTAGTKNWALTMGGPTNSNEFRMGYTAATADSNIGSCSTIPNMFSISTGGNVTFNERSADADFRVESGTNAHALFVDASLDRIGLFSSSPQQSVTLDGGRVFEYRSGTQAMFRPSTNDNDHRLVALSNSGLDVVWGGTTTTSMQRWQNGSGVVFNEDSVDQDFRVESDGKSHAFFVDAGNNLVMVGRDSATDTTGSYGAVINATGSTANIRTYGDGTNHNHFHFIHNGAGSVGSITTVSSGTTYNTTSDRRLKDNIETITDGTDKLMAMNPVTHTWIADPDAPAVHGFIAQEMQEVVPEAVTGEDGGDQMMSMDYGRITPVIVAALQDAHREIQNLKAEIAALKGDK